MMRVAPRMLMQLILSFGGAVEVLAPEDLRQEVIARLKGAVGRYGFK